MARGTPSQCASLRSPLLAGSPRFMLGLLTTLLVAGACTLPSDQSADLGLELPAPPSPFLVGDTLRLIPLVTGLPSGSSSATQVSFESSEPAVATVSEEGLITGVGEGRATITARLVRFESASEASITLEVSRGIVIRSLIGDVSGASVRFGETLTVRGLRLDPDSLANVSIGVQPARVVGYAPADPEDPSGEEELYIAVPIAPDGAELLLVHVDGGTAARALSIIQEDFMEVAGFPGQIDLSEGPFVASAMTISAQRDDRDDWIRFRLPAGDWTARIALREGQNFSPNSDFNMDFRDPGPLSDLTPDWVRAPLGYGCRLRGRIVFWSYVFGYAWGPAAPSEVVLPLRLASPVTMDFRAALGFTERTVPYRVEVVPGYQSDLPPDDAEGNDSCTRTAPLTLGGVRSLTLDTPYDHDWFSFTIPGQPASFVRSTRIEQESNNTPATAETVTPGTRIVAGRDALNDEDWFKVELTAGQLLDVDLESRELGEILPTEDDESRMDLDVRLFDASMNLLDWTGRSVTLDDLAPPPVRDLDGRIRYVVPVSGTYFIRVEGRPSLDVFGQLGSHMNYAMSVYVHEDAGMLQVGATATAGEGEPSLQLVELRPDGTRVVLRQGRAFDGLGSFSEPMAPGAYRLLVYSLNTQEAAYELSTQLTPPGTPGAAR